MPWSKTLILLDYLACGKLDADVAAEIVLGMVEACKDNQCALIGGETAEMPGMYNPGDYDVAGFCVGIVEKIRLLTVLKSKPETKSSLYQVQDSTLMVFSLVRKVFPDFNEDFEGNLFTKHYWYLQDYITKAFRN